MDLNYRRLTQEVDQLDYNPWAWRFCPGTGLLPPVQFGHTPAFISLYAQWAAAQNKHQSQKAGSKNPYLN